MSAASPAPQPRRLACARCGAEFSCNLAGGCWCDDEAFRLPLPTSADADCLCPTCLRKAAGLSEPQNTPRWSAAARFAARAQCY